MPKPLWTSIAVLSTAIRQNLSENNGKRRLFFSFVEKALISNMPSKENVGVLKSLFVSKNTVKNNIWAVKNLKNDGDDFSTFL